MKIVTLTYEIQIDKDNISDETILKTLSRMMPTGDDISGKTPMIYGNVKTNRSLQIRTR